MSPKIVLSIIPIGLACVSMVLAIWNLIDLHKAKQRRKWKEINKYIKSLSEENTNQSGDNDCNDGDADC